MEGERCRVPLRVGEGIDQRPLRVLGLKIWAVCLKAFSHLEELTALLLLTLGEAGVLLALYGCWKFKQEGISQKSLQWLSLEVEFKGL